jgi:uncharacterized protein YfaS (alpha-2-macroglobulin family)
MKRVLVIAAAGVVALALVGLVILQRGRPVESAGPVSTGVAPAGTHVMSFQPNVTHRNAAPTFDYWRVSTDLSKAQPSACLHFTQPLDPGAETHYGDWVTIEPKPDASLRVQDDALCWSGLALGKRYQVKIAAGLPSKGGAKLATAAEAAIDFGDRPKIVQFSGTGWILARDGSAGVTIDTVNVDKVAIEVLRVNDRLAPAMLKEGRDRGGYSYYLDQLAENSARPVWSGTMDVSGPRNDTVHTAFPLSEAVNPRKPGVYVVVAYDALHLTPRDADHAFLWQRVPEEFTQIPTLWVVETDIALTSVAAADGLHVFARSLATAAPLPGIEIQLLAKDSAILGKATTDAGGQVVFAPGLTRGTGAAAASSVLAYGPDQDFVTHDLAQPGFDLSDRGVAGRETPGPLDGFLYTDRGIYRPGERIHAVALLRDRVGHAIEGAPLTLSLVKPNGLTYRRAQLDPKPGGGFEEDLDLPDGASRGAWTLNALDGDGKVVGHVAFEVQDFVPQRLKVAVKSATSFLHPGDALSIAVDGRFLYGAPAGGLGSDGHVNVAVDPAPFPQSAQGFRFGVPSGAFKPVEIDLAGGDSDADGHAVLTAKLDITPPANLPLKASVTAGLREPGGRVTADTISLPIRGSGVSLGIRPRFKDDRAGEDTEAAFEVIAVDESGQPQAAKVHWTLLREVHRWDWYESGGRWTYHAAVNEVAAASGDLALEAERPATITQPVDWGGYKLVVEGADGIAASYSFYAGWIETADAAETPDKVDVTIEKPSYALGDVAHLKIVPPFAGKLRLMLARDKVFDTRELDIPQEGITVDVPVGADWGSGAYALASVYRPADGGRGHLPIRAIGVAWIGVDPGREKLEVAFDLPKIARPRQKIELPVHVTGGVAGEPVYLTLAAVDEGILQLTHFATPDPTKFYFGQRRLAVEIRDDYGRLLDGNAGVPGKLRSGGDAFGGRGLPVVPTKSVALFQGPITLGADGTAKISLDIPDFEGELRVMAVAFSDSAIGRGEGALTVRDPVVEDAAFPRFLAPGDQGSLTMLVDNREGAAGHYQVALTASGAVKLGGTLPLQIDLAKEERKSMIVPLSGLDEGIGTVKAVLTGPGGISIARDWSISVRGGHYPLTVETTSLQKPGESFRFDPHLLDAFVPGSVTASVSYSRLAGVDVPGLLQSLYRYPYGCTEQLSSTAFPLVFYDDPSLSARDADKAQIHGRVQEAVDRIIDRQDPEGTFGLWRAGDRLASDWLSLYALDFLIHAKAAGYEVGDGVIERGYQNAESWLRHGRETGERARPVGDLAAYAAWLLAPAHRADLGRLRQLHDEISSGAQLVAWFNDDRSAANPLALAQLGGALSVLGDHSRGTNALTLAVTATSRPYMVEWWQDYLYWSKLRDAAGILAVAAESDQVAPAQPLVPKLAQLSHTPERLTTQEKAWLLAAAHAVTVGDKTLGLTVNGKPVAGVKGQAALLPSPADIAAGYTVAIGTDELWRSVTVHGSPKVAPSAMSEGLTLTKSVWTMDGVPLDPAKLPQNQRFVVKLEGGTTDKALHHLALVDMLPAGWEIEGVLKPDQAPGFVGTLTATRARESRDDRLVVALDIGADAYLFEPWIPTNDDQKDPDLDARQGRFRVAYVARAITPGSFTLPEAVVEDMYRPGTMARTAAGNTEVTIK